MMQRVDGIKHTLQTESALDSSSVASYGSVGEPVRVLKADPPLSQELENDQVLISSTRCQIRGSDLVERLQLNKRFCMSFTNKLTWTSAPVASTQGPLVSLGATSNGTEAAAASALPAAAPPSESGKLRPGSKDASGGAIHGDSKLEVWVEVLGPFRIFPREFLQATANAVLAGLMRTLLPIFTRKLRARTTEDGNGCGVSGKASISDGSSCRDFPNLLMHGQQRAV
eukprot:jgi/Botrbrau1/6404/Bobra.49_1s0021.1